MYRHLFTMLLCISTALGAPQQDSNITYIKLSQQPEFRYTSRETKIDIVPLTVPITVPVPIPVPNNYSEENKKLLSNNLYKEAVDQIHEPKNDQPVYNYSDRIYSIKTKKNKKVDTKTIAPVEVITEPVISADSFPSETLNTDSIANNENSTQKFDTDVTENYESVTEKSDEVTTITDVNTETTKESIVTFLPKLSHYGKPKKSFSQNLISFSGKRRFRSRCRCEKIWNCAKLQISVARCPDEYFLCCG